MRKIEKAAQFLQNHLELFCCPHCKSEFTGIENFSLHCANKHHFDLSRKGTLFFLQTASKNDYDREMLQARKRIFEAGFFNAVVEALQSSLTHLIRENVILEAGCGDGSILAALESKGVYGHKIGFDISKDGINLAASQQNAVFWCTADLSRPPFAANKFDVLLNILSPAAYIPFKQLLKKNGLLLKVIPTSNYLLELRQLLYQIQPEKQNYSNEQTKQLFAEHFPDFQMVPIHSQFELSPELFADLLQMTPLSWGVSTEQIDKVKQQILKSVTVELELLIGMKK